MINFVPWETVAFCTKTAPVRGAAAKTGVHPEVNIILFKICFSKRLFARGWMEGTSTHEEGARGAGLLPRGVPVHCAFPCVSSISGLLCVYVFVCALIVAVSNATKYNIPLYVTY